MFVIFVSAITSNVVKNHHLQWVNPLLVETLISCSIHKNHSASFSFKEKFMVEISPSLHQQKVQARADEMPGFPWRNFAAVLINLQDLARVDLHWSWLFAAA